MAARDPKQARKVLQNTRNAIWSGAASMLIAAMAILSVPASPGQTQASGKSLKVTLDPTQTQIRWTLNGNLHTTHGTFKLKSGEFFFNPETSIAEGEILVDATSGESGNATRDKKMQDEVLESGRYPAIFFHPAHIKGAFHAGEGEQTLTGDGIFNIHGADHPLEIPATVQVASGAVTVTTHFSIPYVDWGMKNPSRLLFKVSKTVEIDISAKGSLSPAK
jgi:polyisoprenoid-binding protein YceI